MNYIKSKGAKIVPKFEYIPRDKMTDKEKLKNPYGGILRKTNKKVDN